MQSLLTLEVLRSQHPGDVEPRTWQTARPPSPPGRRRRLRSSVARRLVGLATRLDGEGTRSALAR
jgi:hypothetical protein